MNKSIRFFGSGDGDYEFVKSIRKRVFISEQGISEDEEFDKKDSTALFALLEYDGVPAATARLNRSESGYKIGRIAVLQKFRGLHLGAETVTAICEKAFEDGAEKVFVDAQLHAVPFYEKLGFRACSEEIIIDRGKKHKPMCVGRGEFYAGKK